MYVIEWPLYVRCPHHARRNHRGWRHFRGVEWRIPDVGGLTSSCTNFTIGVAVCAEELGVVATLYGMAVNDGGNLHVIGTRDGGGAVEVELHDTVTVIDYCWSGGSRAGALDGLEPFYRRFRAAEEGRLKGVEEGGRGGRLRGAHGFTISCIGRKRGGGTPGNARLWGMWSCHAGLWPEHRITYSTLKCWIALPCIYTCVLALALTWVVFTHINSVNEGE